MHRFIKIRIVRDLDHLQERARTFMDIMCEGDRTRVSFRPAADLYETAGGLVLRLELAGVAAADVSISLAGQELVIRGCRKPPPPEGIRRFLHLEMSFGNFERRFVLPIPVDPQQVEARYADGVLTVKLPRKLPQTRSIPVKAPIETE
jgi:HSP20 family protein